jgi:hypothetical protein
MKSFVVVARVMTSGKWVQATVSRLQEQRSHCLPPKARSSLATASTHPRARQRVKNAGNYLAAGRPPPFSPEKGPTDATPAPSRRPTFVGEHGRQMWSPSINNNECEVR